MPKKTKAPSGPACTSTISGGSFRCVLTGDHDVHCSAEPGRRKGQYAMWSTTEDGRIQVIPYQNGKKMSDGWPEDPPKWVGPNHPPPPAPDEPPVPCAAERVKPMTLADEPEDPEADAAALAALDAEDDPLEDEIRSDEERDLARKMREDREQYARELEQAEKEPSLTDICERCKQEIGAHDGLKCPKPYGFVLVSRGEILCKDGEFHDSDLVGLGGERAPQVYKTKAAAGGSARHQHRVTEIVPWHGVPDRKPPPRPPAPVPVLDVTKLARDPEEPSDPTTPGWTQEPEPKAGDTRANERGQNERWIWGPVGGWGWRSYNGKDKGCAGCGRHKVDCLCKQMKAAPPEPAPVAPRAPLTKIGEHEVHPAAALFPMISEAKWPAFVEDLRVNGQRTKIVLIGKLILDGRNRYKALLELGREPKFRQFGDDPTDGSDPIAFVTSLNIQRRQLDETELAYVGLELVPMYEAQAKERQVANLKQGPVSATLRERGDERGKAAEAAAKAVGVSARTIESAIKVQRDAAPEVLAASRDQGRIAVSAAAELAKLPKEKQREIVEREGNRKITLGKAKSLVRQEEKRSVVRDINEQKVAPAPLGPFGVIVIDPPWPYDNSDQHEGSRGHIDYPSMSIQAICDLAPQFDTRAKDDCILALWITNAFVHEVGRILFSWGFEHRTMITWDKELAGVGSLPRGQTEHLVIATRGAPVHTLNEITTLLRVKRREHSRKPDEMYELLAKHCSGPFIDMFSREPRDGWATWGAETQKFATEAA